MKEVVIFYLFALIFSILVGAHSKSKSGKVSWGWTIGIAVWGYMFVNYVFSQRGTGYENPDIASLLGELLGLFMMTFGIYYLFSGRKLKEKPNSEENG